MSLGNLAPLEISSYSPGVCNIGPAEIARRRRAGHFGLIASAVLLALLVALGLPHAVRLLVALPAAASAVGYLQARFHFCAAFGARGVYNFGDLGLAESVDAGAARSRDRRRSLEITVASLAIGLLAGIAATLLPIG